MTVGNVLGTFVAAVAMILFSRVLGPTQFGTFSVLFSTMLILSRLGDLGVNIAVSRYLAQKKLSAANSLAYVQTGSYFKFAISLLFVLVGLVFGPWISLHWLKLGAEYANLTRVVISLSGSIIFYEYVGSLLQAKQSFFVTVLTNLTQSTIKLLIAAFAFFVHQLSLFAITLSYLSAPILGGLVGLFVLPIKYFAPRYQRTSAQAIALVARWTSISIVSSTVAENLDIIIVQNFLTPFDTGIYSAATRIATVASLVGWSLGSVLNMRVAGYHHKANLDKYLQKAKLLSVLALVATLLIILISTPLITLTLGAAYLPSIPILNILLISTALLTAATPFVALFYVFDNPRYFAVSGLITAIVLVGSDLLLIPHYGLSGAAWARVITRVIVLIYTLAAARAEYVKLHG